MPSRQDPPLGLTDVVQRRAEQNIWHQLDFRSCWQVIMFTMNRLRGSSPDFCRVYSLAFPPPRYSTRQKSHFLSLQWHSFPYFVFLFSQVIGLHGYRRILALCMFTSKILYCQWAALAKEDDIFVIKTTKPLSNMNNWSEEEHIKFIRGRILGKSNEELARVNLLTC